MGKIARPKKHSTKAPRRDLKHVLDKWCGDPFYGEPELIPREFVKTAVHIYKSNVGNAALKGAIGTPLSNLVWAMDALGREITKFLDSEMSPALQRTLKNCAELLRQPPLVLPPALYRYDLPSVFRDLPVLLKAFRGVLSGACNISELMIPTASKALVRDRALIWLFLAVRKVSQSDYDAFADIAVVLGEQRKTIDDAHRNFAANHKPEYKGIQQCLDKTSYPSSQELLFLIFAFPPIPLPPTM